MPLILDPITILLGMYPLAMCNIVTFTDFTQGWILGLLLDTTRMEPGNHLQLRALPASFFPRIPQRHSRQGAQQSLQPQQIQGN
jgi:hypothetical protein